MLFLPAQNLSASFTPVKTAFIKVGKSKTGRRLILSGASRCLSESCRQRAAAWRRTGI